ncbi:unnamed protein product [Heligmosomoides polygyrus]|uniref:40S ribosomal protein S3a n=1 Tax=Heligmosomoides polygyrus TaxID=6339 RepID=A0A183FJD8_HELPZ|nr:unnamed protein product [Heligmosomoides polygyrus]
MRLVCQVVVKMLTKPKQGFCAKVIDHYGSLAGSVPKFLVKVTIDCTNFKLKPRKPKDDKDKDAKPAYSTSDVEPAAKKEPPKSAIRDAASRPKEET